MNYLDYLNNMKVEFSNNIMELKNSGRDDEYKFEKIKENVCDIFLTLFNASKKRAKDDEDFRKIYLSYFENIPKPWKDKLEKDKIHGNFEGLYIEELKLEVVETLKNKFLEG